jgi:hypothetical protein
MRPFSTARVGRFGPAVARWNGIAVGVERDRRARAKPALDDQIGDRDEARPLHLFGGHGIALDRVAHGLQQLRGAIGMRRVVAWRGVGWNPHQRAQECHLVLEARLDEAGDFLLRDPHYMSAASQPQPIDALYRLQ